MLVAPSMFACVVVMLVAVVVVVVAVAVVVIGYCVAHFVRRWKDIDVASSPCFSDYLCQEMDNN